MADYNFMPAGMMEARPPYIRFEVRPVEKRKSAAEGGTVYFVDQIFALVTPHGSKDTTEKIVDEWFPVLEEQVRQGRFSPQWLAAYRGAYEAFKHDQEPPLNGVPIKNWPAASPAEVRILTQLRVLTLEDLAAANEELIGRIGMGGRSLVQRAKDFLSATKDTAPLVRELDSLRQKVLGLESQVSTLMAQNANLAAQNAQKEAVISDARYSGVPPVEERLQNVRAAASRGPSDDALIDDAIAET